MRSGAPTGGKLTASEASASPYTGYIALRASLAGASRVRNSSHSSTEIGSAPLKMRRTADRSSPSHRPLAEHLQVMSVAEIRRAQEGRAHARGEGEPQQRPADEQLGRHEVRVHAVGEHEEVKADQAHVVGERHPRQAHVVLGEARRLGRAVSVGEDVAVGEHDALRLAGRAGGELDESDVGRAGALHAAGARDVIELIDQEGALAQGLVQLRLARLRGEGADALERAALGVDERGAELARDAQQLVAVLVADAERHRHRNDAAEDRRPEGVDELLVAAQEQDQLVAAARAEALQVIQDPERALVELAEGDVAAVVLAIEIGERARQGAIALDELGEGGGFRSSAALQPHVQRMTGTQIDLRLELEGLVGHV